MSTIQKGENGMVKGKTIGLVVMIITEIIVIASFFMVNQSDIIPVLYVQLAVLGIAWGTVSHKNWIDFKNGKKK